MYAPWSRVSALYARMILWISHTIEVSEDFQIPLLNADQVLDFCNKSVGIYSIGSLVVPCDILYDAVYKLWLKRWRSELEFGRFAATLIGIGRRVRADRTDSNEHYSPAIEDVIAVHERLCARVESCDVTRDSLASSKYVDLFGKSQAGHFHVRPVFRALILLLENSQPPNSGHLLVRLVRTGKEDHLSHPISFAGIKDHKGDVFQDSQATQIVTDLATAIRFVVQLNETETPTSQDWQEAQHLDTWLGDSQNTA